MSDHELIQIIEKILDEKMPQNFSYINFSFFQFVNSFKAFLMKKNTTTF